MYDSLEEHINAIVEEKVESLLPRIIEKINQEFEVKRQRTLFNQKEIAPLCGVSVTTFVKWRKMGLKSEPSPTGKLLFDIIKVNKWREENDNRKIK